MLVDRAVDENTKSCGKTTVSIIVTHWVTNNFQTFEILFKLLFWNYFVKIIENFVVSDSECSKSKALNPLIITTKIE